MIESSRFRHHIDNVDSFNYDDANEFNQILETSNPKRILMTPRREWSMNQHQIAFVDSQGAIHSYNHYRFEEENEPIRQAFPVLNQLNLVNGSIKVDTEDSRRADFEGNSAEVYLQFAAELPYSSEKEELAAAEEENYQQWLQASKEAYENFDRSKGSSVFQLYRNYQTLAIDLTTGIYHHTTAVGLYVPRTLESITKEFPGIEIFDHTKVVNWGKVAAISLQNK